MVDNGVGQAAALGRAKQLGGVNAQVDGRDGVHQVAAQL